VREGIDSVARNNWRGTTAAAPKIVFLHHDIQRGTSNNIRQIISEIRSYTLTKSRHASFELP
jgi:hypothetical protein